jgi:hypothetical protein
VSHRNDATAQSMLFLHTSIRGVSASWRWNM